MLHCDFVQLCTGNPVGANEPSAQNLLHVDTSNKACPQWHNCPQTLSVSTALALAAAYLHV